MSTFVRGGETHLSALNGMRVLSMWWVIFGHSASFQASFISKWKLMFHTRMNGIKQNVVTQNSHELLLLLVIVANLIIVPDLIKRFTFQVVLQGTLSVDSFFFLR